MKNKVLSLCLCITLLAGIFVCTGIAVSAAAETPSTVVTTLSDVVDDTDNLISLREAISYAGTNSLGYEVTFDYTKLGDTFTIKLDSENGQLTICDSDRFSSLHPLTITAEDGKRVIISGAGSDNGIMTINLENVVILNNLTFTKGCSSENGGAIYNSGRLTITGSTFTGNTSNISGGAIENDGELTITGSTFTGNTSNISGGAIENDGELTITGSTFTGNTSNASGGAIENVGTLLIIRNTFLRNTTMERGGAINVSGGTATIVSSTFIGNSSDCGNAICNCASAKKEETITTTLNLCNNVVLDNGGGAGVVTTTAGAGGTETSNTYGFGINIVDEDSLEGITIKNDDGTFGELHYGEDYEVSDVFVTDKGSVTFDSDEHATLQPTAAAQGGAVYMEISGGSCYITTVWMAEEADEPTTTIIMGDKAAEIKDENKINLRGLSSDVNDMDYVGFGNLYLQTITYKDQGNGTFSGTHEEGYPEIHTYGEETTLDVPTKTGYIFEGYYLDQACTGTKVTALIGTDYNAEITLYAKWKEKTNVSTAWAASSIAPETYDGFAHCPEVAITEGEKTLVKDIDYTAVYSNNVNAGTATITITPKDSENYKGALIVTFTIAKEKIDVPKVNTLTYNGEKQYGVVQLLGARYTLSGTKSATNAGSYVAIATLNDTANYEWNLTTPTSDNQNINWSIAKKNATLTLSSTSASYTYPTAGSFTYTYDGDGDISANSSNVNVVTISVNTSTKTITVTPIANGSATITVNAGEGTNYNQTSATLSAIVGAGTILVTENPANKPVYTGYALSLGNVSADVQGCTIRYKINGSDYSTSQPEATNAGTYVVGYKVEKEGYTTVESSFSVTISKEKIDVPTANTGLVYNGQKQTGVVQLLGARYTLSGTKSATNAGDYEAIATLNDKTNYEWNLETPTSDNQTISWTIERKPITITANSAKKEYGSKDPILTASIEGIISADRDKVKYEISRGDSEDAGVCTIIVKGEKIQGNYTITFVAGTFVITAPEGLPVQVDANALADVQRSYQEKEPNKQVSVNLVSKENSINANDAIKIANFAGGKSFDIFDATLEVKVDGNLVQNAGSVNNVLISSTYKFDFESKINVQVVRVHDGGAVEELSETPNDAGEYVEYNKKAGTITVNAKKYSTYAFCYTSLWKNYKESLVEKLAAVKVDYDNVIANAKVEIANFAYNEELSLEENKDLVKKLYKDVLRNLEKARIEYAKNESAKLKEEVLNLPTRGTGSWLINLMKLVGTRTGRVISGSWNNIVSFFKRTFTFIF